MQPHLDHDPPDRETGRRRPRAASQRQELVEGAPGPSERAVDVLMVQPGALVLEHHTPTQTSSLATVMVHDGPAARAFAVLREAPELAAQRQQLDRWLAAPPDKVLTLVAQLDDPTTLPDAAGPVTYA